ncbi:MAG: hypothetical protein K0S61_4805 [Anaerocolumna sp.]|jgi:hypothetical protein|nr:hypothetical protein [Anaerocolumna sp.]
MDMIKSYRISYDSSGSEIEALDLESLGDGLYRLHMTPLFFEEISFGDIIEAEMGNDDVLFYRRIVKKSEFKRFDWILSKKVTDSPEFQYFIENITDLSGHCEQVFGGVLIVYLPISCNVDINMELQKVIECVSRKE